MDGMAEKHPSTGTRRQADDEQDKAKDKGNTEQAKPASLAQYARILSYGARNRGFLVMTLGLICAMGSGIALPLMNIVFGKLVGDFNRYFVPGSGLDETTFKASVNKSSLYIVYLFIGKFALTYISMLCFRMISLQASAALRLEYVQALFAQPICKLDEVSVGAVTNTITALSNTIQSSISDKLAILFQSLALLIAAYAIAFRFSWSLTLVVSAAILFAVIANIILLPIMVKAQRSIDEADHKHASIAADTISSIRTVLSLGAETSCMRKYSQWIDEARNRALRLSPVSGIQLGLLFFSMYCSFAVAFWFGLKQYREGHISDINTVVTVFFSVFIVIAVLGNIASPLMLILKAISASASFFDMIDSEQISTTGLRSPDVSSEEAISFRNVTFAYPTRPTVAVLTGFNARFERAKTTALVGPSGSGKSTIIALIERWYSLESPSSPESQEEISRGEILVGNHNIDSLDLKWWRSQIGLVQQEPVLFNESAYCNVAAGLTGSRWENEPEAVKRELVASACKDAFADEFIQRLPLGYDTPVGEGAVRLSGGQRQRLAIARAIVKQPPVLILDEATSSIDVRGEKIVQAALDRVSKGRTTIVIAHRLSTVRNADHIIVINDGANIEEGPHEDLIAKDGMYSSFVRAQQLEVLAESKSLEDRGDDEGLSQSELLESSERVGYDEEVAVDQSSTRKQKRQRSFRVLRVFLYEQRGRWLLYILIIVGALGAGSAFALQSWLFAHLVQVFQYTGLKLKTAANFWSLMFFILALAMAVFYFLLGFASNSLSMYVASSYRTDYFSSMLRQPVSYHDREENASGTLISRLSTDPRQLQELFGPPGVFPLISIFNVIGCISISFAFGWKLAAVTFFAGMPFIFLSAYMRIRYEKKFEALNADVYADSSSFAVEAIRAFRTVTALTMEQSIIDRYSNLLKQQRQKALFKAWYATLVFAFSDSVELCAMALAFWYGGQLLAAREYDPLAFFVVYIAIIQGGQAAGQFFSAGPNIAQATASGSRIINARATEGASRTGAASSPLPPTARADIEFRDVSFKYPSRNIPAFANLNITIESGQFVALVGPSGCGKSTVVSLLERFYTATHGTILFGGQDIRTIELSSYRRALSLVAQEPKLFDGSISDNVLLGLEGTETGQTPSSSEEEAMVVSACKDAEIHDFIASLPDGYATELGVNAQVSLSGGQKQRLCIARALIRKPALLLLDEATSSLDSQSEKLVQAAMERLAMKRDVTIIAVAHRLATIQNADVIFVFGEDLDGQGSRILERGTHHELSARRGAYWQMCQAQTLDR